MSRLHAEWFQPERGGERCAPPGTRALVVGGGIAGIAAATVLCERGVSVTLIEREAQLGGRAASFPLVLPSGKRVQMERGFHAFFRQYYNLRALLRRVDPELSQLQPLTDYPILGPGGDVQKFSPLAGGPLWLQIPKLMLATPFLRLVDLPRIDAKGALAMVSYDQAQTYAAYDGLSAADYLDSLNFPKRARRMLFDVFSHSFFCPERELSAGELLMNFHHYFTGNPEGLIFDVARRPMSEAFWTPFEQWLTSRGAEVVTGSAVHSAAPRTHGGYRIEYAHGAREADLLVLALDVKGIKALFEGSPELGDRQLRTRIERLAVTRPFFVLRLWLDRPLHPSRAPFAGTTGLGRLDNISIYDRFQDESADYHARTGGSVVELHAYGVDEGVDERALRADLIAGLHAFYPESRSCRIVDECMLLRSDASAFPPGGYAERPSPTAHAEGLAICGDYTRAPFPCALMERAASSGMLAASALLAPYGVAPEALRSVPSRGLLAGLRRTPSVPRAMRPSHVG